MLIRLPVALVVLSRLAPSSSSLVGIYHKKVRNTGFQLVSSHGEQVSIPILISLWT